MQDDYVVEHLLLGLSALGKPAPFSILKNFNLSPKKIKKLFWIRGGKKLPQTPENSFFFEKYGIDLVEQAKLKTRSVIEGT